MILNACLCNHYALHGSSRIPVQDTLSVLLQHLFSADTGTPVSIAFEQVSWRIECPELFWAFWQEAGCGCVMQAVVQNPMADPYILGVSAGATLGATGSSWGWARHSASGPLGAGGACFLYWL